MNRLRHRNMLGKRNIPRLRHRNRDSDPVTSAEKGTEMDTKTGTVPRTDSGTGMDSGTGTGSDTHSTGLDQNRLRLKAWGQPQEHIQEQTGCRPTQAPAQQQA